jgi:hypothetical protein
VGPRAGLEVPSLCRESNPVSQPVLTELSRLSKLIQNSQIFIIVGLNIITYSMMQDII